MPKKRTAPAFCSIYVTQTFCICIETMGYQVGGTAFEGGPFSCLEKSVVLTWNSFSCLVHSGFLLIGTDQVNIPYSADNCVKASIAASSW